jgi:hypothetical protein
VQVPRPLADTGDSHVAWQLARLLADRGGLDGAVQVLRPHADAGDLYAAWRMADLPAGAGDLDGLRACADAGDWYPAGRLTDLLANLLIKQGQGEEAERLRRFGLNPDGTIASV